MTQPISNSEVGNNSGSVIADLPVTCLPSWGVYSLHEPMPILGRNWKSFIEPGLVMMSVHAGVEEWLFGREVIARYSR
jgi:hypothetical protein